MGKRNVIDAIGYGGQVTQMAAQGMQPGAISKELAKDPEFMRKLEAIGRKAVFTSDVTLFLAVDNQQKTEALEELTSSQSGTALAVVQAKEHVQRVVAMSEAYLDMVERGMGLLDDALDHYEELAKNNPGEEKNPFPFGLWDNVRKAMGMSMDSVKMVRDDSKLQSIIRAGTLNVNQGMNTSDLLEILTEVGAKLGVPEEMIYEAYTKVLIDRKKARHRSKSPIDAEVVPNPKVEARKPFVRALETSLGMPQPKDLPENGS